MEEFNCTGNEEVALHECDDQLMSICRQLYDATLAPRFQILITQGFVELLVNAVKSLYPDEKDIHLEGLSFSMGRFGPTLSLQKVRHEVVRD